MKGLRIFILAIFIISVMPLEAFCDDVESVTATEHHHCIINCDTASHAFLTLSKVSMLSVGFKITSPISTTFIYKSPFLSVAERPPNLALHNSIA